MEYKEGYLDEKVLSLIKSDYRKLASVSLDSQGKQKKFRDKWWKWVALFMSSILMMSNQFCEDNPATIQTTLETELGISQTMYSMLYAVYAYPNIIFPIFGGIFLDRIGVRIGMILFCLVAFIGQLVFCYGGYQGSFDLMIWGRFIFGMGGENLSLSQTYITCKWFDEKLLSYAFGISTSLAYLATAMNGIILPLIYNDDNTDSLGDALFIGVALVLCGLMMSIFLSILDKVADKIDGEGRYKVHKFEWQSILRFGRPYWIFCVLVFTTFSAQLPFIQVCSKMLQVKYEINEVWAGRLYAIPYLMVALSCPLLGLFIDKNGKRLHFYLLSSFFLIAGHIGNMLIAECDETCYIGVVPVILIGISFSLFQASIWGVIPDLVEPRYSGTALGIAYACQCIAIAIVPSVGGVIHDKTLNNMDGFYWQSFFWLIFSIFSLIAAVILQIENIYTFNGKLNLSYKERKVTGMDNQEDSGLVNESKNHYDTIQYSVDESMQYSGVDIVKENSL